jgi:FdrA protein
VSELVVVHRNSYHDSARLMAISRELRALPGVEAAEVMMGTPMNRELLAQSGFAAEQLAGATPLDLIVALRAARDADLRAATEKLNGLLAGAGPTDARTGEARAASVAEAVALHTGVNLVSVAVPGPYAAFTADRALDAGRHVFLFSDNVPLEDEVRLKRRASELGLLMMGPDCGTAIIAGVGLGFANRVRRGPVGIVGASGTGIQELCCLLDAAGIGVAHAIGTGSRDLKAAVGGLTTRVALHALATDPASAVIALVAKHPDADFADRVHEQLARIGKPAIVRYLGEPPRPSRDGVRYADSLDEAAAWLVEAVGVERREGDTGLGAGGSGLGAEHSPRPTPHGPRLIGLFGGGSLAAEAAYVLSKHGIATSAPDQALRPGEQVPGGGHLIVDTGDDVYTVGKPHPMVDQTVRCGLIRAAGSDPAVGVVLFDLVLGDGAHPDPAPDLAAAVAQAREARGGATILFVASICGTVADPQGLGRQAQVLRSAGVHVVASAARAAVVAAAALRSRTGRS